MVALEVEKNGGKLAVAGRDDLSVLNVIVDAVGKLGKNSAGAVGLQENYELTLRIGGLTAKKEKQQDEHLNWRSNIELKIGDMITIRVIDSEVVDQPTSSHPAYDKEPGLSEKELFEDAKKFYLKLKDKYELMNEPGHR